jgi:hypothetical protein
LVRTWPRGRVNAGEVAAPVAGFGIRGVFFACFLSYIALGESLCL